MTSFSYSAYVIIYSSKSLPLSFGLLSSTVYSFISLSFLSLSILSHTIHSVLPRLFYPPCPSRRCGPSPLPGLLRRYAADGNPRCPLTDTNGYLCQRRNLLLYIPLYKQRVNRAPHPTCAAYGGPGPPVSPSSSARQVRRGYPIRAPRGNRFIDRLFAASLPPDRSVKLECANPLLPPHTDEVHFRANRPFQA